MEHILPYLSEPVVQDVIQEWDNVRCDSSIVIPEPGTDGAMVLIRCIRGFFSALYDLAKEFSIMEMMNSGHNLDVESDVVGDTLRQAEDLCCDTFYRESMCALVVLHRRLRARALSESDVIRELNDVVSLLAPGFSLASFWNAPGTEIQRDNVWRTLGEMMSALESQGLVKVRAVEGDAAAADSGRCVPPSPPQSVAVPPV